MSAENRLSAEQLAALKPGETVTVESGAEFGRRRYATATVVRVNGSHVVVWCEGPRGGKFVEHYGLRDGVRRGGGHAELVNVDVDATRPHGSTCGAARSALTPRTGNGAAAAPTWTPCGSCTTR